MHAEFTLILSEVEGHRCLVRDPSLAPQPRQQRQGVVAVDRPHLLAENAILSNAWR